MSTLADWVGACSAALSPLVGLIRAHVLAAERIHGDDTTVPVLAKTSTTTGRLWTYVRDDRPFCGSAPPAALFHYSRDRGGAHPARHLAGYSGILQADAYAGFNDLYHPGRQPGPVTEAACWAHGRRKLFAQAQLARAPIAAEAVRRIDTIFDAERDINGLPLSGAPSGPAAARCAVGGRARDLDARRARQAVPPLRGGEGDGLHAQALGGIHPVPRRWPHLPDQQRRRARAARHRDRPQGVAVRGLGPGRGARCRHVHADRHGQAERRWTRAPGWPTCCAASPTTRPRRLDELLPWNCTERAAKLAA